MPVKPFWATILVFAAIVKVLIQFLNKSATFWLIPRPSKSNSTIYRSLDLFLGQVDVTV